MRIQKGLSIGPIINLTLITIAASDKIQRVVDLPTWLLLMIVVPGSFGLIWFAGYVLTTPSMRVAEDEAMREICVWRSKMKEKE